MLKIFFSLLVCWNSLFANELFLAQLVDIQNNAELVFQQGNQQYLCRPYGVKVLDEFLDINLHQHTCSEAVSSFYKRNKHLYYFSKNHLKLKQYYHIEGKGNRCIIYSNGAVTYSEMLLKKGLAMKDIRLKDRSFLSLFNRAQKNAQLERKGLWKTHIPIQCIAKYKK